jgi:hypothetical protein
MFDRVLSDIFDEFRLRLTAPATGYMHYGAINGIIIIIGEENPDSTNLSLEQVRERTQSYLEVLQTHGINIDEQKQDYDIDTLIRVIGRYRNVSLSEPAQMHLNTLIVGVIHGIVRRAALDVQSQRPDRRYINVDELEQACRQMGFQGKPFMC